LDRKAVVMDWYEHYMTFCDHVIIPDDDTRSQSFEWIIVSSDADEDTVSDKYRIACKTLDYLEMTEERAYHIARTKKGFVIAHYDIAESLGF